jgi:DNA-directed RNA polymerase specialized sigma24 family protein
VSLPAAGEPPLADPQRAFLEHLATMDRVIAAIARRNSLDADDASEFRSWLRARIIGSDYAVFRKFAGRSSLQTYLTAVLGHLFLDYRNHEWGRWRPSAAAVRLGAAAIKLDELLNRDGYALREAVEVVRSSHPDLSARQVVALAQRLPIRNTATEVPLEALDGSPYEAVDALLGELGGNDDFATLRAALHELADEDQLILRMRFWDDVSIADIARTLRLEQKPLYRRIAAIEGQLRALLRDRGVDHERAREMLASEAVW